MDFRFCDPRIVWTLKIEPVASTTSEKRLQKRTPEATIWPLKATFLTSVSAQEAVSKQTHTTLRLEVNSPPRNGAFDVENNSETDPQKDPQGLRFGPRNEHF